MNDPKPTRHWNDLAEQLGLDVPEPEDDSAAEAGTAGVDDEGPDGAGDPSAREHASQPDLTARKKRREPKRPAPLPPTHWDSVADHLGVELPERPEPSPAEMADSTGDEFAEVVSPDVEPRPVEAEPPAFDPFDSAETSDFGGELADELSDTRDNFMDEIPNRDLLDTEPEPIESASDTAETGEAAEAAESGGRRRRRRGRRGRRRRPSPTAAVAEGESSDDENEPAAGETAGAATDEQVDFGLAEADTEAARDDDRDAVGEDVMAELDGPMLHDEPDDPRHGDDAALPGETADAPDKSAGRRESGDDRGRSKRAARRFPTWSEAVGVIVTANIESRQKSGSPSGARGRKRRPGGRKR
jgi:ribonuclease E